MADATSQPEPESQEPADPAEGLSSRHRATLVALFAQPIRADVTYRAVENLLVALGAEVTQGSGSRVRAFLNGVRLDLHKPHPQPQLKRYAVKAVRDFLMEAGARC